MSAARSPAATTDHRCLLAQKIIAGKPSSLTDHCTDGNGNDVPNQAGQTAG